MNYLNGGYVMIKHNATQKDLAAAYKSNRPVLVYDENQKAHWAQINETVTTEIIDDEAVTTYIYSYQLLNDIASLVDSAGNSRFIEGSATLPTITGVTFTYGKWSLSGTHLMCVIAGTIASGNAIANGTIMAQFQLPTFILDKIYPTQGSLVLYTTITSVGTNFQVTNTNAFVDKITDVIRLKLNQDYASQTVDKNFRVQIDLLIDADYSE